MAICRYYSLIPKKLVMSLTCSVACYRSAGGRPSPTYRIYSNAFQGGRVSGDGAPFYYGSFKVKHADADALVQSCIDLHAIKRQACSHMHPTMHACLHRPNTCLPLGSYTYSPE